MKIDLNFSFLLCFLFFINSIHCDDFKCPEKGKVGELKVPDVTSLIDEQNGYHASVEVVKPTRKNLIHDYYHLENKFGFIDLEATIQDKINQRYYYHSTDEKIDVQGDTCNSWNLTQNEKMELIKDWFEPKDIVASSEMFKDLVHLGPTGLMIYANSISDKASFIGSELIEGRAVNHWFYCTNSDGPYIDFYFDVKTSLPYRFSLYYPEWIETQEAISIEGKIVKKQVDSESKHVYNFYSFKPLVISTVDTIPYPLGYGCVRKGARSSTPLPDFSQVEEFAMDMEAIITYSDRDPVKSTCRVMKRGDVISYEIQEETEMVRSIEMPPPLGRFLVYEHTGRCRHYITSYYSSGVKLITDWPLNQASSYNLLYYLVMKPPEYRIPTTFIAEIPLGPFRVKEYRAENFFTNRFDAIVDYYYTKNASAYVPDKVIFTKSTAREIFFGLRDPPTQVEVTIINYKDRYIDYEDRFDVSACYEEPGSYTWFQLLFSNPSLSQFNMETIKESTEEYLTSFIPITRIGEIHAQQVYSNVYVTVKLYDRVPLIDAYTSLNLYTLTNPSNIVQRFKLDDCEQLCSANPDCDTFSYCDNYDCSISTKSYTEKEYKRDCKVYIREIGDYSVTQFVDQNYLSTMSHVLQKIRNKVSAGEFRLDWVGISAEDLFIVNGPEEIGDISQELITSDSNTGPARAEDFPIIKIDRQLKEAPFKIEKVTLQDCFMACFNDDDCNTLSYCINQNKECILSGETLSSLNETLADKTNHADGCNIYQKSFTNLFHEYPGKSLVLDAVSTISDVPIADCAKRCALANDFSCESFDYCKDNKQRNESVCFLHVNHIEIDKAHRINATNWKSAEAGCSHYSKKFELDYEHKVGLALKENTKESIVATFDHLLLEHCASKCNADPNCFTLEFCETIDYNQISDSSSSLTSCSLTNLKPINVNQPGLFEESKNNAICSIYINHKKIAGKSRTKPQPTDTPSELSTRSTNFTLTIGLSTIVFVLAFSVGFFVFAFAAKRVIS